MKVLEKILFALLMILMVLPAIQKEYAVFPVKKLQGDFNLSEKPAFSWHEWNTGDYQARFDIWLEEHIGFRNLLVRINNQVDFSIFGNVHADGVVKGKQNVCYEFDYIREYTGNDFVGESLIDQRIRKLKFLQQHLKNNFNTDLVLVFEPGKARFMPEFIPSHYLENQLSPTNYEVYQKLAKKYKLKFIDWNKWYVEDIKQAAQYPVYTKYGIHWSGYGMTFALDSMIGYIEKTRNIQLREMKIDSFIIENKTRTPDYDIGNALNLLFRLPEQQQFAYPEYSFGPSKGKSFPNVLVVGDSYYWNIFNTKIANELFNNQAFWYFNNLVYPDTYCDTTRVADLNIKQQVEQQDVVFLMVTGRFLYKFDWRFVDNLYNLYAPRSKYDKSYDYMTMITTYSEWFDNIVNQSIIKNQPLADVLLDNAYYVYHQSELDSYMCFRGLEFYEERIRSDQNWLNKVQVKANENNISLDEMITKDALYVFQTQHPDSFETYLSISNFKKEIRNNPDHLNQVKEKAANYFLTLDEMLQIEAERLLEESK